MKNKASLKKPILAAIQTSVMVLAIVWVLPCHAANIKATTYYPALSGHYDTFQFYPQRTPDLTGACPIGTLYVNSAKALKYCRNDGASVGVWGSISDYWIQTEDEIYLMNSVANQNMHVGIGTMKPEFKLTLINDGGIIAKGTFGSGLVLQDSLKNFGDSRFIWYPRKASLRAIFDDGFRNEASAIGDYSVAFGKNSWAYSPYSVVGGGDDNGGYSIGIPLGAYATVIGGRLNLPSGNYSSIIGGENNQAKGIYSTVVGGLTNIVDSDYTTILGGINNIVSNNSDYSVIGAGNTNLIKIGFPYSNINGGYNNIIEGVIPNAMPPTIAPFDFTNMHATIGGGYKNKVQNYSGVVTGGKFNYAVAVGSSIGGGDSNRAGYYDINTGLFPGLFSRVSGGYSNATRNDYATISGGYDNTASGLYSTIGGGSINNASGQYSTIGGGENNTASGAYAMIIGGSNNSVAGDYSWVEGKNMKLSSTADRTFLWGYSDDPNNPGLINTADAFIIAPGIITGVGSFNPRVGIRDTEPAAVLEINANGTTDDYISINKDSPGDIFIMKQFDPSFISGSTYIGVNKPFPSNSHILMQFGNANDANLSDDGNWNPPSSRQYKENIQALTSYDAQETLDNIQPVTFHYKGTPKHQDLGFIAEDVPDLVAMNGRDKLNTMDFAAVLIKVAQDQDRDIKQQDQRIKELKTMLQNLKNKLGEK